MCFYDLNRVFHIISESRSISLEKCKEWLCEGNVNAANFRSNRCSVKRCSNGQLQLRWHTWKYKVLYKIPEYWKKVIWNMIKWRGKFWFGWQTFSNWPWGIWNSNQKKDEFIWQRQKQKKWNPSHIDFGAHDTMTTDLVIINCVYQVNLSHCNSLLSYI